MLVHFPVALWPAHLAFHLLADRLPAGTGGVAGFWTLAAGTILGWLAAGFGLGDLLFFSRANATITLNGGLRHAALNGTVLLGFTVLLGLEFRDYPIINHTNGWLLVEVSLLGVMLVGNYFGGKLDWRHPR